MLLIGSSLKDLHKIALKMKEKAELRVDISLTKFLGMGITYNE